MPAGPILYDGWVLAYQPNHPAAIHLLTLLYYHPEDLPAHVALPADSFHSLPDSVTIHKLETPNGTRQRLDWEQRLIPHQAQHIHASCLHVTSPYPGLFGKIPTLVSPCEYWEEISLKSLPAERGLTAHLRTAFGQGGLSRARAILWPDDLPDPGLPAPKINLAPVVHPAFLAKDPGNPAHQYDLLQSPGLPDGYILYHGPGDREALEILLSAWSWAAGPLGDSTPLVILGLRPEQQNLCTQMTEERGFQNTIRMLPALSIEDLAALYRGCIAILHPVQSSPWGGTIRAGLACGKPIVARETAALGALVGKAAYLVQAGKTTSSRAFGAALITVVVEESVGEGLAQAAQRRSQDWGGAAFADQLSQIYQPYRLTS